MVDIEGAAGVALHPSNLPWLKNLSKAFDMYRWLAVRLEYRPLVGTTKDGAVAVGLDWATSDVAYVQQGELFALTTAPTRDQALACTPCFDTPIWTVKEITAQQDKLRQKNWYSLSKVTAESTTATVLYAKSGDVAKPGEIWLHYRVILGGTRAV